MTCPQRDLFGFEFVSSSGCHARRRRALKVQSSCISQHHLSLGLSKCSVTSSSEFHSSSTCKPVQVLPAADTSLSLNRPSASCSWLVSDIHFSNQKRHCSIRQPDASSSAFIVFPDHLFAPLCAFNFAMNWLGIQQHSKIFQRFLFSFWKFWTRLFMKRIAVCVPLTRYSSVCLCWWWMLYACDRKFIILISACHIELFMLLFTRNFWSCGQVSGRSLAFLFIFLKWTVERDYGPILLTDSWTVEPAMITTSVVDVGMRQTRLL